MKTSTERLAREWGIAPDVAAMLLRDNGYLDTPRIYSGCHAGRVAEANIVGPDGSPRASISPSGRIEPVRYWNGNQILAESMEFLHRIGLEPRPEQD